MDNGFLRSFLKARASLNTSGPSATSKPAASSSTIPLHEEEHGGMSLTTIIEESPSKAKVLEYLRKRILELEADDD